VPPQGPHGQQHWPEGHPECGGRAQSPIDVRTQRVQPDPSLPPIRPVGHHSPGTSTFTLANNGHTGAWVSGWGSPCVCQPCSVSPCPTAVLALPPSLRLEGLPRSFAAVQLHFHWGHPGHAGGAEHLLDGHRAPAEVRGEPQGGGPKGGGGPPNPPPTPPNCHMCVPPPGQTTAIPSFSVQDLLPPRLDLYYRYNGSLTTPPCFQSVLWTLFQQPVRISLAQLEQLQGTLYATAEAAPEPQRLVDNFRVPQELNQRLVLSSF
ncbi:CAH14 anhydrase, partial [Podargus strigoides]|nr:CAH14 anhydrase [Podargus strigoides]